MPGGIEIDGVAPADAGQLEGAEIQVGVDLVRDRHLLGGRRRRRRVLEVDLVREWRSGSRRRRSSTGRNPTGRSASWGRTTPRCWPLLELGDRSARGRAYRRNGRCRWSVRGTQTTDRRGRRWNVSGGERRSPDTQRETHCPAELACASGSISPACSGPCSRLQSRAAFAALCSRRDRPGVRSASATGGSSDFFEAALAWIHCRRPVSELMAP